MPGPRQEVIDGCVSRQPIGTVEAFPVLRLGERAANPVQADPLSAEEEFIEPLRINEIRVAGGDHRRPLGLDEGPDERGEPD